MPEQHQRIVISNEDHASKLLADVLRGADVDDQFRIAFEEWPYFSLKFEGRDWHGTVPTRVMPAILEIQKSIYRTYAEVKYGEPNSRRLTDDEREQLELVVKVEKGSSKFDVYLGDILNKLVEGGLDKMEPTQIVITVLGLGLLYTSGGVVRAWLASKEREHEKEQTVELSKQETRRVEIITEASRHSAPVGNARVEHEENTNRVLRTLKPADKVSIGEAEISGEYAAEITHVPRETAEEGRLDGRFRVLQVDASGSADFKIKIERIGDGLKLQANVPLQLPADQRQMIEHAEWQRRTVQLEINAKQLRGIYTSAVVISASNPEDGPN